jgi:thymidylate synthase (FAD)
MHAQYVDHYLSDHDVANFARHSFAKLADQFTTEQNHSLIRFLARGMSSGDWDTLVHQLMGFADPVDAHDMAVYLRKIPEHWAPFAHPHITLRMSAPVPIRTQCFKHKIGLVESEESRRYIRSEPQFYLPEYFRPAAANVKQGSADVPHEDNEYWLATYKAICEQAINTYLGAITAGVCPEQARFFLPQGTEVNWVWTGSLYAFANFYNQRSDSHAQKEIQLLAQQVGEIIRPLYPVSWDALTAGVY